MTRLSFNCPIHAIAARRGLAREPLEALAGSSDWTPQARNVLLFGPSGVGKTHLAAAIGRGLSMQSVRVRFFATTALVQQLQLARTQLHLQDALHKLDRYAALILDDFGYVKKSEQETRVLFELIAHRYETGSLIITSNQPFAEWDRIFPDPMMTVAAVDRLVHHATIIEVGSDSYRRKQALGQIAAEAATITLPSTTPPSTTTTSPPSAAYSNDNYSQAPAIGVRDRTGNCRCLAIWQVRDNYPAARRRAPGWAEHWECSAQPGAPRTPYNAGDSAPLRTATIKPAKIIVADRSK